MSTPTALIPAQAAARLDDYTVIDVRTPGEYAAGHLSGAHNIPLDHLHTALPALKAAAARGNLLMVCASGNRSTTACTELAAADIPATPLTGGTTAWATEGHTLHRPDNARNPWPIERQVRLAAGSSSSWASQPAPAGAPPAGCPPPSAPAWSSPPPPTPAAWPQPSPNSPTTSPAPPTSTPPCEPCRTD